MYFSSVTRHYYSFPSTATTYSDAYNQAAKPTYAGITGHLWVPNSNDEFERVLYDIMYYVHYDPVWLALTDEAIEGTWVFTAGPERGADVTDLVWWAGSGEPNGGTGENCAAHWPGGTHIGDASCFSNRYKYVVEFECLFGQRFNDQGTACIGMFTKFPFGSLHPITNLHVPDVSFFCENSFEGGGWLQVRYISSSPEKWYRAQDGLRGTDVYGYPGLSEYSIYFKNLMQPSSELLFVIGRNDDCIFCLCLIRLISYLRQQNPLAYYELGASIKWCAILLVASQDLQVFYELYLLYEDDVVLSGFEVR